jgi:arylsulfatase A-like enzyme
MKRRDFIETLGAGVFACSLAGMATGKEENSKPNILLILADDLGFQDLGCQGSPDIKTPNIDKIAANGITFSDGHVSASVCSPSRAGLVTGRYQQRFGHEANCPPKNWGMDLKERTIGDELRALGYRTGIIGKWHLGDEDKYYPTKRGFDYFYGLREGSRSYWYEPKKDDKPGNPRGIECNGKQVKFDGYITDVFGEKAIEFIEKDRSKPFFLYLSFTAPHGPMHAKEEDMKLFPNIANEKRRKYSAMNWAMDRAIGKVMATLDKHGLTDNTIVWFLSDNGGATGNASINLPLAGHKGIKFEGGIRVPFLLQWKKVLPAGQKFDGMTSALDILPTCVRAAGGELSKDRRLDGVDLMPYLTKKKEGSPHDKLFWHKLWFSAMRDGPWKLIYVQDYGYALYNLDKDLGENKDLSKAMPDRVKSMRAEMDAWKASLMKPLWGEGKVWFKVHSKNHIRIIEGK